MAAAFIEAVPDAIFGLGLLSMPTNRKIK